MLDHDYLIYKNSTKPTDYLTKLEAQKQLNDFIKTTQSNDVFETNTVSVKKNAEIERFKGNDYLRVKDYKMALQYYEKSISISPESSTYSNMALAHLRLNNFDQTVEAATKSIELDSNNFKAYFRRGEGYFAKKMYDSAYNDYFKSDSIESTDETKKAVATAKEELEKIGKIVTQPKAKQEENKEKFTRVVIEEDDDDGKAH